MSSSTCITMNSSSSLCGSVNVEVRNSTTGTAFFLAPTLSGFPGAKCIQVAAGGFSAQVLQPGATVTWDLPTVALAAPDSTDVDENTALQMFPLDVAQHMATLHVTFAALTSVDAITTSAVQQTPEGQMGATLMPAGGTALIHPGTLQTLTFTLNTCGVANTSSRTISGADSELTFVEEQLVVVTTGAAHPADSSKPSSMSIEFQNLLPSSGETDTSLPLLNADQLTKVQLPYRISTLVLAAALSAALMWIAYWHLHHHFVHKPLLHATEGFGSLPDVAVAAKAVGATGWGNAGITG